MTHNYARYLAETIESVLSQTVAEFELIVSDDASSDNTHQVVRPFLSDSRVQFVRHDKNLGQAKHWGWALQQGTAPVVGVLHGDDAYLPNALSELLAPFENESIDLTFGNFVQVRTDSNERKALEDATWTKTGVETFVEFAHQHTYLPSASLLRRGLSLRCGDPDPTFAMLTDREYSIRLAFVSRYVARIPAVTTRYRIHASSMTATTARDGRLNSELIRLADCVKQALSEIEGARPIKELDEILRCVRDNAAQSLARQGLKTFLQGDRTEGKRLMAECLKISPKVAYRCKNFIDRLLANIGDPLNLLPRLHPGVMRELSST